MARPEERARIIRGLAEVQPPILFEFLQARDVCVLTSWTAQQVLRHYGIHAKPVVCRALVMNRRCWEWVDGDIDQMLTRTVDEMPDDVWNVGLGFPGGDDEPRPGGGRRFPAHVVLTTRNPDMLIDLSADQAARPQYGIKAEPFAVEVPREELQGWERQRVPLCFADEETGSRAVYLRVTDVDFRRGTDWHGVTELESVIGDVRRQLVDHVREKLEEHLKSDGPPPSLMGRTTTREES